MSRFKETNYHGLGEYRIMFEMEGVNPLECTFEVVINQKELEMDRYLQRNKQKYIYFICLHVTIHLYFYPYTLLHQIIVCTYMEVMYYSAVHAKKRS